MDHLNSGARVEEIGMVVDGEQAKARVSQREAIDGLGDGWESDNSRDAINKMEVGRGEDLRNRDSSLSSHDSNEFSNQPKNKRKKGRGGAGTGNGEDAKNRRLEKNRQSAKESRLRKKQYIGHLEERNKQLEKQMAKMQRKISMLEDREKLNYLSHVDTVEQMLDGRQQLYDRLEEQLEHGGNESRVIIDNIIA